MVGYRFSHSMPLAVSTQSPGSPSFLIVVGLVGIVVGFAGARLGKRKPLPGRVVGGYIAVAFGLVFLITGLVRILD